LALSPLASAMMASRRLRSSSSRTVSLPCQVFSGGVKIAGALVQPLLQWLL
jgi:hypothetical protein